MKYHIGDAGKLSGVNHQTNRLQKLPVNLKNKFIDHQEDSK